MNQTRVLIILLFVVLLRGPAFAGACGDKFAADEIADTPAVSADDPYETFNRHSFAMNEAIDKVVIKPVASIYRYVIPWPIRTGITNAFNNLNEIPSFANSVLQFRFGQAATTAIRFGINSTVGIIGFIDVASHLGLEHTPQDFGLTLARWGNTQSPYFVIPLLGPSTVRDTVGVPIDYYLSIQPHMRSVRLRNSLMGLKIINTRANLLEVENVADEIAFDRYTFVRDAYLQNRNARIQGKLKPVDDEAIYLDDEAAQDEVDAASLAEFQDHHQD